MGIFWKRIKKLPPVQGSVTIAGDKEALSKRWPILWRFHQNRVSLLVREPICYHAGYRIFFHSGTISMECRRVLFTKYVVVRIGPEPVTFWVEDLDGVLGELVQTPGIIPGLFRKAVSLEAERYVFRQQLFGRHTSV